MPYYHVRIWLKESPKDSAVVCLDLTLEVLESRVLVPRRQGLPITLSGKTMPIEDIDRIKITVTEQGSEQLRTTIKQRHSRSRVRPARPVTDSNIAVEGKDVTDEFITGPPGSEMEAAPHPDQKLTPPTDAREVFVVHGRNGKAREAIFAISCDRSGSIRWNGQRQFSLRENRCPISGKSWMLPFQGHMLLLSF